MSYIKKEPLLQLAKELQGDSAFGSPRIVMAIEDAPAEDVVEVDRLNLILKLQRDKSLENLREYIQKNDVVKVVRCTNCKYCDHCYPVKNKGEKAREGYYCNHYKEWVSPNHYCGYGKRRIDNEQFISKNILSNQRTTQRAIRPYQQTHPSKSR